MTYKIYKMTAADQTYFGQTSQRYPNTRFAQHKWKLKNGKHENKTLQDLWGNADFTFKVLHEVEEKELADLVEEELITGYDCCNIFTKANEGHPPDVSNRIVVNGIIYNSQTEAAKAVGCSAASISRWLTGRRSPPKDIKVCYHKEIK